MSGMEDELSLRMSLSQNFGEDSLSFSPLKPVRPVGKENGGNAMTDEQPEVDDEELKTLVQEEVRSAGKDTTVTVKQLRKNLEARFGCSLKSQKAVIKAAVAQVIAEWRKEEAGGVRDEPEVAMEEEDEGVLAAEEEEGNVTMKRRRNGKLKKSRGDSRLEVAQEAMEVGTQEEEVDVQLANASGEDDGKVDREGGRLKRLGRRRESSKKTLGLNQMSAIEKLKALRMGKVKKQDFLQEIEKEEEERLLEADKEKRQQQQQVLAETGLGALSREERKRKKKEAKAAKRREKKLKKAKQRNHQSEDEVSDAGLSDVDGEISDGEAFEENDEDYVPGQKRTKKKTVLSMKQLGVDRLQQLEMSGKSTGFKSGRQAAAQLPLNKVDPLSNLDERFEVFSYRDNLQAFMLNQVDVTFGKLGHNKYYMGQVCEREDMEEYICFFKWARVGAPKPASQIRRFQKAVLAMECLHKKFYDKTRNQWSDYVQGKFSTVSGKYTAIDIEKGESGVRNLNVALCQDSIALAADAWLDESSEASSNENAASGSGLAPSVASLIRLICSKKMLAAAIGAFNVDIASFPLGKLSRKQLKSGFNVLSQVADCLSGFRHRYSQLAELSNKFYTLIPHNFGMKLPPVISSRDLLLHKVALVESLLDVQESNGHMFKAKKAAAAGGNLIRAHYDLLRATITHMSPSDPMFAQIARSIKQTHGPSHSHFSIRILDIFGVEREVEEYSFLPWTCLPNRKLLWHGSRITNLVGIISNGLRVAPPEAPKTGYMFGKGLYFADCASKSANYLCATRENPEGLLLLCDVALGTTYKLKQSEFLTRPPAPFHSTMGLGRHLAREEDVCIMPGGSELSVGPLIMDRGPADSKLLYNEYIVYDTSQVRLRYLVKVKLIFDESFGDGESLEGE